MLDWLKSAKDELDEAINKEERSSSLANSSNPDDKAEAAQLSNQAGLAAERAQNAVRRGLGLSTERGAGLNDPELAN